MQRVDVFGGTGRIGRLVTEQFLATGHDVILLVRSPDKVATSDPRLSVHVGQLSDVEAVAGVVRGSDVVTSALGPSLRRGALDWTLARITRPIDGPARGTVRAGFLGRARVGWAMTRADVAAFLVGQLEDETYLRAAPAISD